LVSCLSTLALHLHSSKFGPQCRGSTFEELSMTDRNRDEKRNPREKHHPAQKSGQKGAQNPADRREQGGSQSNLQNTDSPSPAARKEVERERNQGGQASRGESQRDEQGQFRPEGRDDRSDRSDRADRADRADSVGDAGGSQSDDRTGRPQPGPDRENRERTPTDEDVDSPQRRGGQPSRVRDERSGKSGS
jgi:transcription termination factor Rho